MADEPRRKKTAKTESLTIRLDPKTRFALEFVARVRGQTITKVIEQEIIKVADETEILAGDSPSNSVCWRSYWDVNEGVRYLQIANDALTNPTYEEEEVIDFVRQHWKFFSTDARLQNLKRDNIEVLWPMMPHFMEWWREKKSSDRSFVFSMMNHALAEAGLDVILP
ncbi:hypothetical protein [Gluconobacter potus]|uniref:hypothetical protein n=1 Tax=Gluconobacter potus TaxID=2724927 RepID=UPI0039E955E3